MRVAIVIAAAACGDNALAPDAARSDAAVDAHVAAFGAITTLSDPANASFVPAIAWRAGRVVVAWHDFAGSASRVVTRTIVDGNAGPIAVIPETLAGPKRPSLAATASGFTLAYDATDSTGAVVRAIDLDADGNAIGAPLTIGGGAMVRVAAHGDDVAWAWTTGSAHFFARRGPVESVPATAVGTTLQSQGLLNFPRLAVTASGTLLLAYRDGGATPDAWDVLLMIRQTAGPFAGPLNVSRSPGLLSDDIALAMEPDDTLEIVWVDQDPVDVNTFEVTHATRAASGLVSAPSRFGTQAAWSWTPSVAQGPAAAWHTGQGAGGDLWLSIANGPPQQILAGEQGGMVALAHGDDGSLHLAYVSTASPRAVRYAARR
jgi:hypothetical protein